MDGVENILWWGYLLAGVGAWVAFGILMYTGRRRMLLVQPPYYRPPNPPPKASILIPAKDEGERIRDCILSALNQDYPNFEVIVIDDRSTDRTGQVMDEIAAEHPKLKVIHIPHGDLPPGWTGKCNALQTATAQADGEWLLFIDSDVVIQPPALSAALTRSVGREYDLLSLLPRLESHSFWESALVPVAAMGVSMMYAVALTNKDRMIHSAFANGQFLLIRRSVYDEMNGHAAVRDKFCEDIEFARLYKASGKRVKISWGNHLVAVRMYDSLESILKGWARIFYAGSLGKMRRILAGIAFVLLSVFSLAPAVVWGVYRAMDGSLPPDVRWTWLVTAGLHYVIMTGLAMVFYAWTGNPRKNALVFPLAAGMLLRVFTRALKICTTRQLEWRGTSYSHTMAKSLETSK